MFGLLLLIGLGTLVYYLATRKGDNADLASMVETRLMERNREWAQFIANYRSAAQSKSEKDLIERMLADIASQGLPIPSGPTVEVAPLQEKLAQGEVAPMATSILPQETLIATQVSPVLSEGESSQLDNTSLLLYFGAFLFIASVGLFIAFSGVSGGLKTLAVLIVAAVLYGGGLWLYQKRNTFEQVGLTLAGISLAVTPFVGLAAYQYIFDQSYGSAIWFATSVLCLLQYLHALMTLRKPLLGYLLIFTILSLFESGVAITPAPIYYFGWALAALGIALIFVNELKGYWPEIREASHVSAQVFLPVSLLASGAMITSQGVGQFGVSLLLAAAFYGLETWRSSGNDREINAVATHVAALGALVALGYAITKSWPVVAGILLVANIAQVMIITQKSNQSVLWQNFGSLLAGSLLVGMLTSIQSSAMLFASVTAGVVLCMLMWRKLRRNDMYVVAVISWMSLPVVLGQYVLARHLGIGAQTSVVLGALVAQATVYLWYKAKLGDEGWRVLAQWILMITSVLVVLMSLFVSPLGSVLLVSAIAGLLTAVAVLDKDSRWAVAGGVFISVVVLRNWLGEGAFLVSIIIALSYNIAIALWYRQEANRWLSTVLWLLLPLGLGEWVGSGWSAAMYAWAYIVAMFGLIFSRTIARGRFLLSGRVPLASYVRTASLSYVVGYGVAAGLAVMLSLFADESQLHTTLILALLAGVIMILTRYVERRGDIVMLAPILLQATLWSGIRPVSGEVSTMLFTLTSTLLALGCYFVGLMLIRSSATASRFIREGALLSVFIAPTAVLFTDLTWTMPLGLLAAGGLLYYHVHVTSQQNRELTAAVMVVAVLWFMGYAGIDEIQAYSHVLVALFAGYAYWRYRRNEKTQSDQYLMAMLITATAPLAIQAISGAAGGLYGWWLLLEQVAFMVIGIAIRRRFVVLWGLYVAVGSVLYQLRHLGWAALTVLALFVIGMAAYQIQRSSKND